ncbi:MAG: hypothetical protein AAGA57_08540, partial [Planctomycetota bacterium]
MKRFALLSARARASSQVRSWAVAALWLSVVALLGGPATLAQDDAATTARAQSTLEAYPYSSDQVTLIRGAEQVIGHGRTLLWR